MFSAVPPIADMLEGHSVELPGSEASPQLHSINHSLRESVPYFDSLSLIICACLSAILSCN